MPKVDPQTDQMMSDAPDQADEDAAGGGGSGATDQTDTGHHSPISASPGATDEGAQTPTGEGGSLQDNPGGGGR